VDVVFGDPIIGEPDVVVADDVLAFAGISPPTLRLYPIETHIAEKLHAYTMPRTRPNSRVKDLPDIALLATAQHIDATQLRAALAQTFSFRRTHPVPTSLPSPLETWRRSYEAMAREDQLPWPTLEDVTHAARAFLDPVLSSSSPRTWSPSTWTWTDQEQPTSTSLTAAARHLRTALTPLSQRVAMRRNASQCVATMGLPTFLKARRRPRSRRRRHRRRPE
jgi:hypothetical protein